MPYRASGTPQRSIGKWPVGFALFVALLTLFASLQLFQLTAEGSAKRTLRRSIATITEIDPLLDRNYDSLQRSAENASPGDSVELAGFPVDVPLTPAEVTGESKLQLRDLILNRASDVMYSHGTDALRAKAAQDGNVGRFSVSGLTQHGLGFLRSRNHDILAVTTLVLTLLCAALAVTLALICGGFGRLTGIGAAVLAASIPVVAGGIGVRLFMRVAADGDAEYVQREFLEIGQGLAWIPIRDGAAFTILGLTFLVIGIACSALADRRGDARTSATRP